MNKPRGPHVGSSPTDSTKIHGDVVEWPIAPHSKCGGWKRPVGSNPTVSSRIPAKAAVPDSCQRIQRGDTNRGMLKEYFDDDRCNQSASRRERCNRSREFYAAVAKLVD